MKALASEPKAEHKRKKVMYHTVPRSLLMMLMHVFSIYLGNNGHGRCRSLLSLVNVFASQSHRRGRCGLGLAEPPALPVGAVVVVVEVVVFTVITRRSGLQ